uniref:RUN domain-containing protein n=1 Tax=Mesocestoides corti TaxID=53468 RepID=A0A5K3ERA8_MESCO
MLNFLGTASKRKTIESCVIELEAATQKLHLVHNTYALSLITARQYHRWLVTRLQPCLYRNLNRCLRLIDYGLSYLLRLARVDQAPTGTFDFLSPPEADPLGATTLDCSSEGGMGAPGDDTFRRAFPFDADLLVRAGDEALQPDKIVVDQLTFCHIQKLLQNHLQEAANQGSITRVLESEHGKLVASISSWVSVLSSSGSTLRDLPTIVKTDEAMTRLLEEVESLSPLESLSKLMADDEKLFLGTAMKPGTLCALAIQLGTCEFFHCQSVCFGDSHMQIVNVLREGNAVAPSPPLPTLTINATTNFSHPTAGDDGSIDMLESRFHCLRVQVDNQDGSVSGGRHSSVGESDSENEVIPQRQEHSPLVISPSSPPATPQRRSIKSIKEELYRQSLASLSKPSLTLTDSRSTNRHSVIATSKSPHRFSQGRFAKKDPPTSLLPDKDAFLKSRANSTSSVDVNHNASAPSTMLISPSQPPTGGELPSHRLDQLLTAET